MSLKLNIGCGPLGKDDWINIDWGMLAFLHRFPIIENILIFLHLFPKNYNIKWPRNLKLHNCAKKLPYRDSTVDFIYTSHFLEHLKKYETEEVIKDYYRVLRKKGMLRIVVPDVEVLLKKYVAKDWDYFKKIYGLTGQVKNSDGSLHLADVVSHYFYPYYNKNKSNPAEKFLIRFMRPHQWMFDFESMKGLLEKAGFKNIRKADYKKGTFPDIGELDTHRYESLYIEAVK